MIQFNLLCSYVIFSSITCVIFNDIDNREYENMIVEFISIFIFFIFFVYQLIIYRNFNRDKVEDNLC
ncbi:hypothetical protein NCTC12673_gp160 [Campylobacter phage NCTC12673]|uniref:Uncharacterized protein n=2 Tax=Fletchervirus NCTC12673 TaxID=934027 RepID=A0A1B0XW34_9CAUD|nr:hypothetical protein NCTC12673_gp160 [Campylobacter phage NCTC12673]YP_009321645.1 hypothetical protein BOX06_gp046 [Campylobacter phage PC14]AEA86503.1 hypothetical protein [Campylobacter phage NCTC12673]ANH51339.1 hypothetical protein PC14_00046 [Campylobacter phage PC14]AVR55685.1 hypothetical protein [Campylobacter phage CP39]